LGSRERKTKGPSGGKNARTPKKKHRGGRGVTLMRLKTRGSPIKGEEKQTRIVGSLKREGPPGKKEGGECPNSSEKEERTNA